MKIGIDTFGCGGGNSWAGLYLSHILKYVRNSEELRFELFGWEYDRYEFGEAGGGMDFIPRCFYNGKTANALWHIFKYPRFARDRGYGACFFPAAHRQPPYHSPCPSVGVIHDMVPFWGTFRTRLHLGPLLRMVMPHSLRRLDRIIAVSRWVKEQLVEVVGVKENRIEVVPNGVDHSAFYPREYPAGVDIAFKPFSIKRPYILYVSRIDHPVKNHVRLIRAFDIFKERTGLPHRLVLAGRDSTEADRVKAAAEAAKFRGDIFFTERFPVGGLPELYAAADFSVLPSLCEGFGMGVLESMASGIPVACARAGALPEVADNAALYFDPESPEDMADRMTSLACDRVLHAECVRLGIERAAAFSWDKCAERTMAIIKEAGNL